MTRRPSLNPALPPAKAYEAPSPPLNRDLGPPPPGYGRYTDFDRVLGGGPVSALPGGALRRNLDEVLCFKVRRSSIYPCHFLSYSSSVGRKVIMPTIVEIGMSQAIAEGTNDQRGLVSMISYYLAVGMSYGSLSPANGCITSKLNLGQRLVGTARP